MSRKLEKSDFIPLLKEVSDKLEQKGIRNEIPFVHKDKQIYDFIKILIPQETDATILEDIFKSSEYQTNGRFIDFYYKDFRFVFIRTVESEFFPTFFYYSWDIMPTLMNVILNKMGLDITPSGLRYIASEKDFMISNNIKLILEFLGLNFQEYVEGSGVGSKLLEIKTEKGEIVKVSGTKLSGKGFNNLFDEISYITTSPYFNVEIFKEYSLNPQDFFYFEKQPQYKYALSLFDNFNNISFEGYNYDKDLDTYLLNIDLMFPGSNFLENITKLKFGKDEIDGRNK
jgi:hypothetical protein